MEAFSSFIWNTALIWGGSLTNLGISGLFMTFFLFYMFKLIEYLRNKYLI